MKLRSRILATPIVALVLPVLALPALSVDGEFDASSVLPAQHPVPAETLAYNLNRIVSIQTTMIRHEATEYQRKVAEARARAYMAEHVYKKAGVPPPPPKKGTGTVSKTTKKHEEEPVAKKTKVATPEQEKVVKAAKAKLPRYITEIDTVKDKRSSPDAKKVVMIWDTQSEALVGNSVYDVTAPPSIGTTAKFETYSAQYVGEGL